MKKILVLTMLCLFLAACGNTPVGTTAPAPSPSGTTGTEQQPTPTLPPETTAAELPTEPVETTLLPTAPSPDALIGTWVRTGTEVEGDQNDGGNCTLVIDTAADGTYTATYTDLDFPDSSYADKALHIEDRPMYAYCGNESWGVSSSIPSFPAAVSR